MRFAFCAALVGSLTIGCSIPDYTFNGTEPIDASSPDVTLESSVDSAVDTATGCKSDPDCAGKIGTPYCDIATGSCVQCLASSNCGKAEWCNANACVPGCKDDSDCATASPGDAGADADDPDASVAVAKCDPTTHMCAGCKTDEQCPLGFVCKSDGVCRPGCTESRGCQSGRECCSGACLDTTSDLANCGGCGTACTVVNGTGVCTAGVCKVASCAPGFANCDGDAATGCEANLVSDTNHCGGCNNKCPSALGTPTCATGVCKYSACAAGRGDCDGSGTCSTLLTGNASHCGACGNACVVANGTPACTGTTCSIGACNAGYGNCNSSYGDGCEQRLNTAAHCGACGRACTVTNGTAGCTAGACTVASCNTGYANCDSNAADCERNLNAATNTCGAPERLRDSGSNDPCGYGSGDTVIVTTNRSRYYRVRLQNSGCSSAGGCNSSTNPVRARIVLQNPSGVSYDLRVYANSSCSTLIGSSTSGALGGTETVTYNSGSCSNDRDLWIEVKYRAGVSCANATLTVNAGYSPYP